MRLIMGKNYVCSDIHGMKGSYEEALKKLNEDDVLQILGDAIDRGDDGIEILIDIAIHSETRERYVVYRALYGDKALYIRPYEMFASLVDKTKYPNAGQEYRFELVN